jgi:8-oxo-dGTP pyrophosphatase MutT (NUDIX family)
VLEDAIRAAWCLWTSDPVDQPWWTDANPASGQCASTALVVQDRLGGELLIAEVHEADGTRQGVHYWNRLPDGRELDLTREQFRRGEVVSEPRLVERPPDVARGRLAGHYHLLAARVAHGAVRASAAVTVQAVCRRPDGRALRRSGERGEWELPEGRPQVGELLQDCARRALREQTTIEIAVRRVLEARPDVVTYDCVLPEPVPDALPAGYAWLVDRDVLGERDVGR